MKRLLLDDSGSYPVMGTFFILAFAVFANMLMNIGLSTSQKVEVQNAADAAAQIAAIENARALNSITAANHLTGEVQALVILHHALGGYELDGKRDPDSAAANERKKEQSTNKSAVEWSYDIAKAIGGKPPLHSKKLKKRAAKKVKVGGMIHDTRMDLGRNLAITYGTHGFAFGLQKFKFTAPVGYPLAAAAFAYELVIDGQLTFLEFIEKTARAVVTPKTQCINSMRALQAYAKESRVAAPINVKRAHEQLAELSKSDIALYPGTIAKFNFVPVESESKNIDEKNSMLMKAAWPHVVYWRQKPVSTYKYVFFGTSASSSYEDWTKDYATPKTKEARNKLNNWRLNLQVLEGRDSPTHLGRESWTTSNGSDKADELFSFVGFARRYPPLFGVHYQSAPRKQGIAAYAQAMTYNANPQRPSRLSSFQQTVGWHTLNWSNSVPEYSTDKESAPTVSLGWNAKLVPATRMQDAKLLFDPLWKGKVTRTMLPFDELTGTH